MAPSTRSATRKETSPTTMRIRSALLRLVELGMSVVDTVQGIMFCKKIGPPRNTVARLKSARLKRNRDLSSMLYHNVLSRQSSPEMLTAQ